MTWALGTPPATARRHASIFGHHALLQVGKQSRQRGGASISLTSEVRSGHRV